MGSKKTKAPRSRTKRSRGALQDLSSRKSGAAIRGGAADKVEAGSENIRRVKP